ncbi:hypothetical protein GCM10025881_38370 [Pseudolysinimonas kribbensis]|uniref:Integration host factor-like helix-two turn-helix domain-containing protein n=1 Tax=Pseudolysinimonas kribbensis TaxID=433641 RepID=A0ABQ6K9U7_9MICO|nr:hypothetical protein GCM10025881_38370 [Pseudolysinimonas kribbensis]
MRRRRSGRRDPRIDRRGGTPPEVDRAAASRAAIAARRARAAVKHDVAIRARRAIDVAEAAWAGELTAPEAAMRVRELLLSIPNVGPTKTDRVMAELGIARSKKIGGSASGSAIGCASGSSAASGRAARAGPAHPTAAGSSCSPVRRRSARARCRSTSGRTTRTCC